MKLTDLYDLDELLDTRHHLGCILDSYGLKTADVDFDVHVIPHDRLSEITNWNGISILAAYKEFAHADQHALVQEKTQDFDTDRIVILDGKPPSMTIIDGNHHVVAAILAGQEIKAINLSDDEPDPSPET